MNNDKFNFSDFDSAILFRNMKESDIYCCRLLRQNYISSVIFNECFKNTRCSMMKSYYQSSFGHNLTIPSDHYLWCSIAVNTEEEIEPFLSPFWGEDGMLYHFT